MVAYLAKKAQYGDMGEAHRRLSAVLRVFEVFPTHRMAADWYRERGCEVPSNCVIPGNGPLPLKHTDHSNASLCDWEGTYKERARENGTFVICKGLFRDLESPPVLRDRDLINIFGRIPGTQNPGDVGPQEFRAMCAAAGVPRNKLT